MIMLVGIVVGSAVEVSVGVIVAVGKAVDISICVGRFPDDCGVSIITAGVFVDCWGMPAVGASVFFRLSTVIFTFCPSLFTIKTNKIRHITIPPTIHTRI